MWSKNWTLNHRKKDNVRRRNAQCQNPQIHHEALNNINMLTRSLSPRYQKPLVCGTGSGSSSSYEFSFRRTKTMRRVLWLLALMGFLLLPACGSDNKDIDAELNIDRSGFTAHFDLTEGILPFPTNLLFANSMDGTLNIPVEDPANFSDPAVAMNTLDGFSLISPISTRFSGSIHPATLTPENVRVFEVTLTGIGGAVTEISRELIFGAEFIPTLSSIDESNSTLVILPLQPLLPRTSYLVMLTDGIRSATGLRPQASAHYLIAKTPNSLIGTPAAALEPVRQLVNAQEFALANQGIDPASIVLSWTFTTQSTSDVLEATRAISEGTAAINPNSIGTTQQLLNAGPGLADVYAGFLDIPYYLNNADANPVAPLQTFWQGINGSNLTFLNPVPVVRSTETIPLLATIPNTMAQPEAGWPVVIYQHGITTNRTTLLAIADALAHAGFAAVAIDLPLHGLPPSHLLYMEGFERTFDLDLVDNATGAPGPDGVADSSGTHFINLASLLTSRDNLRQGVADLFSLTHALETMAAGTNTFDTDNIYFVGHSLGAMVGSVFMALEDSVRSGVFGMSGGGIAKLLDGSATIGPRIAAGLAANGVIKGTPAYESFMGAAQTVVDSADPINYTVQTIEDRGILMFKVIGDQTIPNNVTTDAPPGTVPAPLSGTDPYATLLGLAPVNETTQGVALLALVSFIEGTHASLLDPTPSLAATTVMHEAMATFVATDGATVFIGDEAVVE
jgi:pimeloyl-ACP methyl ester carboxylesterase